VHGTLGFVSGFGDGTSIAKADGCSSTTGTNMNIAKNPSPARADFGTVIDAALPPFVEETSARAWPRCEPASTHFELGVSADYRPTAVMAKRYTPKYGVRKE
jgi:hypothetical protein